jgi:LysM repeat protein
MRIQHWQFMATAVLVAFLAGCVSHPPASIQKQQSRLGQGLLSTTNIVPGSVFELEVYVIKAGDTLRNIAETFQVSIPNLKILNPGLTPILQVGQQIRIFERKYQ